MKKREKSPIKVRILQYLDVKMITRYSFYKNTGVSRGILDQGTGISEDNLSKFFVYARDISPIWLLTGEGEMLLSDKATSQIHHNCSNHKEGNNAYLHKKYLEQPSELNILSEPTSAFENYISNKFTPKTDRLLELQRVPLYNIEATAEIAGLFLNPQDQTPTNYLSIPNLPRCDGAVHVRGDSMYPILKSGDIVLYKQIQDTLNIIWGEMYLISFAFDGEEFITVKYINKIESDKNKVALVCHNTLHATMEITIESIYALGIIKASVRFNTMK